MFNSLLEIFGFSRPAITTNSPIENYDLNEVIQSIFKDHANQKKVCLFVGRTPDQPVPDETELNRVWYTIDTNFHATEETILHGGAATLERHIQMDLNDCESLKKIEHLFNVVLVDGSVLKGVTSIWSTLHAFLVTSPDAEIVSPIIVNSTFGTTSDLEISQYEVDKAWIRYSFEDLNCGIEWAKEQLIANPESDLSAFDYLRPVLEMKTINHLENLFDLVILHKDQSPPCDELIKYKYNEFWHLVGPKVLQG
jgi:hypothetical protein